MIKLIKNELIKIFKKKSFYIAMAIVFIGVIAVNGITKYSSEVRDYSYENSIEAMKESLARYNPEKPENVTTYIEIKSSIDELELMQKYGVNSWQANVISEELGAILQEMNTYQYGSKDEENYEIVKKQYDNIIEKLENGDWKYFARVKLEEVNKKIEEQTNIKSNTIDKRDIKQIESRIAGLEIEKQVLNWRLEKDISYATSSQNSNLTRYERYAQRMTEFDKEEVENNHELKVQYQRYLKEAETIKYAIEHDWTLKENDVRGVITNFFEQYGILIVAVIVMIAGTIISEEFSKGTVKLLLVKPYPRWKIILSKFITTLIVFVVVVASILVMELLVGGILYGFDSLKIPAIYYDFNTNQVGTMNVFSYFGIKALAIMPQFILVILIAFMLSSLFTNSALAIVIALLGFMSNSMINMVALEFDLPIMRFFITLTWDLTPYLFGGISEFPYTNFGFSAIMNIVYFIGMLGIAIFVFQKRNIKNI